MPKELKLHLATVEVRFKRGMVYLDHCGEIMVKLQDLLGDSFVGTVPQMAQALLTNPVDQLTVQYSPQNFFVTQVWPETGAKVIHVAPKAWKEVAETMEVQRHTIRCGARFVWIWPVDTQVEADALLRRVNLFAPGPIWADVFGSGDVSLPTFGARMVEASGRVMKISVAHGEGVEAVPKKEDVPPYAILLDIDIVREREGDVTSLGQGQLADFTKAAWADALEKAQALGRKFGDE